MTYMNLYVYHYRLSGYTSGYHIGYPISDIHIGYPISDIRISDIGYPISGYRSCKYPGIYSSIQNCFIRALQ